MHSTRTMKFCINTDSRPFSGENIVSITTLFNKDNDDCSIFFFHNPRNYLEKKDSLEKNLKFTCMPLLKYICGDRALILIT